MGLALAAAELIGSWTWVGGGGGISLPLYPADMDLFPGTGDDEAMFFYFLCLTSAIATYIFYKWLYSTRFGLAVNAIRDDEEKAEGMGIHTLRYKTVAWASSAFFLGISGALHGNIIHFIEPLEVAFPTITFGIFMVAMALLGGKGTIWGPVLGAVLFHTIKEVTWTHLLGWQWIALGLIIIINVVFFQQGIVGWMKEKWPSFSGSRWNRRRPAPSEGGSGLMAQKVIEVSGVSKSFGGVVANKDISLEVEDGKITGLIGPNGSGKTTLFNSIVGYHPIDEGSIRFEGQEISKLRVQEIARLGLLRTFQQTRIYSEMNCVQNMLISIPHRKHGFMDMFGRYGKRIGEGGAAARIRRPLQQALPAQRRLVLRPAEAAGIRHGADERTQGPAAGRNRPPASTRP